MTEPTLIDQGYYLIKEYQMWGKCPTFKHPKTGKVFYTSYENNIDMVDWETIKSQLRELWRPVASEEIDFFERNL